MSDLKVYYDGNASVLAKSLDDVLDLSKRLEYEADEDHGWQDMDWKSDTSLVNDEDTGRQVPFNKYVREIIDAGTPVPVFVCFSEY